jgi:hypothetical protein
LNKASSFFAQITTSFIGKEDIDMKKKDMFYSSEPSNYDGRCSDCPYVNTLNNTCTETDQEVYYQVHSRRINYSCPFLTK